MKKCTFVYECRACEKEYDGPVGGYDPALAGLISALFGFDYPSQFIGMPPRIHDIHHCDNKQFVGVADLKGFKIEEY